jgi:hypothetical protein
MPFLSSPENSAPDVSLYFSPLVSIDVAAVAVMFFLKPVTV